MMAYYDKEHGLGCPAKFTHRRIDCTCRPSKQKTTTAAAEDEARERVVAVMRDGATEIAEPSNRRDDTSIGEVSSEEMSVIVDKMQAAATAGADRRRGRRGLIAAMRVTDPLEAMAAAMRGPDPLEAMAAAPADPINPVCRRCSDCEGVAHHWLENPEFEGEGDAEYACKHCPALCVAIDDDNGLSMPSGRPFYLTEIGTDVADLGVYVGEYERLLDDKFHLDEIGNQVSSMSGRLISLVRGRQVGVEEFPASSRDLPIAIQQVCPACREQHEVHIGELATDLATVAAVGLSARRARLTHRCPTIASQLEPLTMTELETLAAELERDGTEMVSRSQEIAKLAAAKGMSHPDPELRSGQA